MTKPKCKTCVRLRREAKEDAKFIAETLLEKMRLLEGFEREKGSLIRNYEAALDRNREETRMLRERIEHLNGEILKQPFAMPWKTEPVERPKTAFIIENPVITFPPGTIIDGGIAQLPECVCEGLDFSSGHMMVAGNSADPATEPVKRPQDSVHNQLYW